MPRYPAHEPLMSARGRPRLRQPVTSPARRYSAGFIPPISATTPRLRRSFPKSRLLRCGSIRRYRDDLAEERHVVPVAERGIMELLGITMSVPDGMGDRARGERVADHPDARSRARVVESRSRARSLGSRAVTRTSASAGTVVSSPVYAEASLTPPEPALLSALDSDDRHSSRHEPSMRTGAVPSCFESRLRPAARVSPIQRACRHRRAIPRALHPCSNGRRRKARCAHQTDALRAEARRA